MKRVAAALLCLIVTVNCGGGKDSPTAPTPTPVTPTRIIQIAGDLSFGEVIVGQTSDKTFTVRNLGTGVMTVTGLNGPSGLTASWTSGPIAAGGSQDIRLRFAPTEVKSYSGTVTVSGDQTSGLNTIPVNAQGASATPTPPATPQPVTADVEYIVSGSRASLVTLSNAASDTAQFAHVEVPWSYKFSGARSGQFLYVSAQNDFPSGCIRVQIVRRGVLFRNTESCGAYVIATASGSF